MARALTPLDCYALINAISAEITGLDGSLTAVDTSTFISVGESILNAGTENTLNAISIVLGRTFMAVRPYEAKLKIFNALNSGLYTNRVRKISYYSRYAQPSGAFNTNLYTNHAMGFDNGSNPAGTPPVAQSLPTMWEQNQPIPLELNFAGRSVWDDSTTIYEDQLQAAFRSEDNFSRFMSAVLIEKANDIETQKEAYNRGTLLNYLAGLYDMDAILSNGMAVDLAASFNTDMSTNYSRTTLLTTHFKDFLEYVIAYLKKLSNMMTNRSLAYHWSPAKTIDGVSYALLRHTPKSKQRLIMYRPFWIDAEARVLPEIFHDTKLEAPQYEGVDYWQDFLQGPGINVTPAIPDTSDPTEQTAGTTVTLEYVVGVLYDEDAVMVDYQLDAAYSTPVEARKRYRNIWYHFAKNSINDFTENGVLLYIGAGGDDT